MKSEYTSETEHDVHRQNYAKILTVMISPQLVAFDNAIRSSASPDSLASSLAHDDYGYAAISMAATFLGSACDGLKTIAFLRAPDNPSVPAVTVNGTAALARQALECSAVAGWLLESPDIETLRRRGFAAIWADALEHDKFLREINDPVAIEISKRRIELLTDQGIPNDYFHEDEKSRLQLKVSVMDSTSILQKTQLDSNVITPEVTASGNGYGNAAWLFRFTSGQTHGRQWATIGGATKIPSPLSDNPNALDDGKFVAITKPNYMIIGLAITTACNIIEAAISRFIEFKTRPLSSEEITNIKRVVETKGIG